MSPETLVAGIDSSTQSTKVILVRARDGKIVDQNSAPHPTGTEVHPDAWWDALQQAGAGLLNRAAAISVAGQQHGMVVLDTNGEIVRPALLWNDLRSASHVDAVVSHLGGAQACADTIGSIPAASFTITKLRWMLQNEPDNAHRTNAVLLPHDWLTWMLGGRNEKTTDHGDASGTGYYSPRQRQWLPRLAGWALGRDTPPELPRIAEPSATVGRTTTGAVLAAGTGDNMAAALGLGLKPGDIAVSVGTSGTAFCVADNVPADPTGSVSGFADATGNYLPLVCTINAAKVLALVGSLLGVDHHELADLALTGSPGAGGLTLLPYLDGERTPNRPTATGVLRGLTSTTRREDLARAAVEGLLCSLADAVDALDTPARRILMIGGGSRNHAVQELAAATFGIPVELPNPGEYVALGAARQAAWALAGTEHPPTWTAAPARPHTAPPNAQVRAQYRSLREQTTTW